MRRLHNSMLFRAGTQARGGSSRRPGIVDAGIHGRPPISCRMRRSPPLVPGRASRDENSGKGKLRGPPMTYYMGYQIYEKGGSAGTRDLPRRRRPAVRRFAPQESSGVAREARAGLRPVRRTFWGTRCATSLGGQLRNVVAKLASMPGQRTGRCWCPTDSMSPKVACRKKQV